MRLFAFLRIGVGCVALLLADQIRGHSSLKKNEVFIPLSVDFAFIGAQQILDWKTGKTECLHAYGVIEVNDHPAIRFLKEHKS